MNARIKTAIQKFSDTKWIYGGGAMDASQYHGNEPWFNTIGASIRVQGDVNGTWHGLVTGIEIEGQWAG
jgi:hypothetical protein